MAGMSKKETGYFIVFRLLVLREHSDLFLCEIINSLPLEVLKHYLDFGWQIGLSDLWFGFNILFLKVSYILCSEQAVS